MYSLPARQFIRRVAFLAGAMWVALASCARETTAPSPTNTVTAHISFTPVFPAALSQAGAAAATIAPYAQVHIVLERANGTRAVDTLVNLAGPGAAMPVVIVPVAADAPASGEPLVISVDLLSVAGVSVFHGGPVAILAVRGTTVGATVSIPLRYTGVGATATGVSIVPRSASVSSGDPFTFSAVARDAGGATLPSTPIVWTSLDPSIATILTPGSGNGVAQNSRGTARIVAQLLTGQQDTVTVVVSVRASAIAAVSGSGQTGTTGQPLAQPLVVRVTGSDGSGVGGVMVSFAVASGGGNVSNGSVVTDASGFAQTTWQLGTTAGAQTVNATASGLPGSPVVFTATAATTATPATQLAVTTQPQSTTVGATLAPVVITARDASGSTANSFTGLVTIALGANPGVATLSGTASVNAVAGVATFSSLSLNQAASGYTLVATATGLTSATTSTFNITTSAPSVATKLVFITQPATTAPGATLTPSVVVQAQDASGTQVTNFTGNVTIAIGTNPGAATLSGATTVAAVNGNATFSTLSLNNSGSGYTLVAASSGLISATTSTFNIIASPPPSATKLVFITQPATVAPGATLTPNVVVQAQDASGMQVTSFTGNVTIAIGTNPGAATLSGTATVTAVNGNATFSTLSLNNSGSGYTLVATSSGLTSAVSNPFNIAAGTATRLVFSVQPGTITAGQSFSPSVAVQAMDAQNNIVTSFAGNVTVQFLDNPGAAALTGTTTVTAVSGVATFPSMGVNKAGVGYTLTASAVGLTSATSSSFNVTAPSPPSGSTISWINSSGGSWSNPANWNLGRVPQTPDSVVIALAGTYTVTLDTTFTATFITIGGASGTPTLSITSRTLTVNNVLTVRNGGAFTVVSSTIAGSGFVVNQGLLVLRGTSALTAALATAAGSTMRVEADGSAGGNATTTIAAGFTNSGVIELTSLTFGFAVDLVVTSGTLTNAAGATITSLAGAGGARTLQAQLNNQGTLTIARALTISRASSAHTNSGTITLNGGDLLVAQSGTGASFTNTGTLAIGGGQTLSVSGGSLTQQVGATIGGAGTLLLNNVPAATFNTTLNSLAAFTLNFVTATFGTAQSTAGTVWRATGSILNGASLTNASGQTLWLQGGSVNVPLINQGLMVAFGMANAINGALTTTPGSTLRVDGGNVTLTVAQGFTNNGTIELAGTSTGNCSLLQGCATLLNVSSGTIINAQGATVAALGTVGANRGIYPLDNRGTVTIGYSTIIGSPTSSFNNTGTITVNAALRIHGQNITNAGTISIATGAMVFVSGANSVGTRGGTFTHQSGASITGGGALTVSQLASADINATPSVQTLFVDRVTAASFATALPSLLTAMTIDSSTVTFATTVSTAGAAWTVTGSTLNGPGLTNVSGQTLNLVAVGCNPVGSATTVNMPVMNQGVLQSSGIVSLNGALTTAAGSTLRIPSCVTTVANSFTNNGTVELSNGGSLTVTAGPLINAAGAAINTLAGAGGSPMTIRAPVNNQGTITMAQGSSIAARLSIVGDFTTSGTINLQLGGTSAYDFLAISNGATTLSGTLNVTLTNNFVPVAGQSFTVLTSTGAISGAFASITLPPAMTSQTSTNSVVVSR